MVLPTVSGERPSGTGGAYLLARNAAHHFVVRHTTC